jgi:quinol monooxygenase YgiN
MEGNMLNCFRLLIALAILSPGFTQSAHAADTDTTYIVTYFEVNFADKDRVGALARRLDEASSKEGGNLRFEVLQRIGQPDQFVILEGWKDKDAHAAHAAASHTREFREKLAPLLRSAYDERPHSALAVGAVSTPDAKSKSGIFAVTHVDIVPTEKDKGIGHVKEMTDQSRSDNGNVRFEALTQISRPNHMTVVEIWKDKHSIDSHEATANKKQFREKLTPMSGSLYDERFYKFLY